MSCSPARIAATSSALSDSSRRACSVSPVLTSALYGTAASSSWPNVRATSYEPSATR